MSAAEIHDTVAHLRHLARTDLRRMLAHVRDAPEGRVRQCLAVAMAVEHQPTPTPDLDAPAVPAAVVELARRVGRNGLDALAGSWLDRAEADGLEVDDQLTEYVDTLVDRALTLAA